MIQLFKVFMDPSASDAVSSVLGSGYIGQGPKVDIFEDLLQEELGLSHAPVTVNSCTSALDLALHLCGVGPGDEVISTAATCFASNSIIVNRGATIKWADIDPDTFLIDPKSVEKLITPKTKAIMAVDWAGRICDFKALKSFGIPVIEDAAHCWDVFLEPKTRDFIERGDYICYSFQAIKFLTCGDGGLLVCQNKAKSDEARLLRWYGLDRTKGESFRCVQNIKQAGFKYHMNDIAASIGIANLAGAKKSVIKHRENAEFLLANIGNPKLKLPTHHYACSFWLFSLSVESGTRDEFIAHLKEKGVASNPVHYRNDLYDCVSEFKSSEPLPGLTAFDTKQIAIPVGWWLSTEDLNRIVEACDTY